MTSDLKGIVLQVNNLMKSVTDLLQANLIKRIIKLGKELGMQNEINISINILVQFFTLIENSILTVKEPIKDITALHGLVAMITPLSIGFADCMEGCNQGFADAFNIKAFEITDQIKVVLKSFKKIFQNGHAVLEQVPTIEEVDMLLKEIDESKKLLQNFQSDLNEGIGRG